MTNSIELLKEEKYSLIVNYLKEHPIDNLEYDVKKGYILIDYKKKRKNTSNEINAEYSLPDFFDVRFIDSLANDNKKAIEVMEFFKKTNKGALKEALLSHLAKKDMSMSELGIATGYSKQTISKIINGQIVPKRKTMLAIVLALRLNIDEAKELLSYSGYIFNPTDPFDVVIEGAITYGYNFSNTNFILASLGLDTFLEE